MSISPVLNYRRFFPQSRLRLYHDTVCFTFACWLQDFSNPPHVHRYGAISTTHCHLFLQIAHNTHPITHPWLIFLGSVCWLHGITMDRIISRVKRQCVLFPYWMILVIICWYIVKIRIVSVKIIPWPLTHLGLVSHICVMKNSPHFPSDAYICVANTSISLIGPGGDLQNSVRPRWVD